MSFDQIRNVLLSRAHRKGLDMVVKLKPWPEAGAVRRIGNRLVVTIDIRQSVSARTWALAHEAGHILFGHYELEDSVWTLMEGPGADEWEWEADYFAHFATRTPNTPPDWFLREQLDLLRDPTPQCLPAPTAARSPSAGS